MPADYAKKQKTKSKRPVKNEREALTKAVDIAIQESDVPVKKKRKTDEPNRLRMREYRRKKRAEEGAKYCGGTNLMGEPCKSPALRKGTFMAGSGPASGNFCGQHDPAIDLSALRRGSGGQRVRRPLDLLAEAVARAPGVLFESQFEALGKEWDADTGELVDKIDPKTGKRSKGATHVGFSREGIARKSRHKDYSLQERIANNLADRLFGKPKQALEIASAGEDEVVDIPQTAERAVEVAAILSECGAIPGKSVFVGGSNDDEDELGTDKDDE